MKELLYETREARCRTTCPVTQSRLPVDLPAIDNPRVAQQALGVPVRCQRDGAAPNQKVGRQRVALLDFTDKTRAVVAAPAAFVLAGAVLGGGKGFAEARQLVAAVSGDVVYIQPYCILCPLERSG